jgi:hypothetical protein
MVSNVERWSLSDHPKAHEHLRKSRRGGGADSPVSSEEVDPLFAAEGQVIGLKKKIWKYKDIVRRLLNGEPLTADEKAFLRKEGVNQARGR